MTSQLSPGARQRDLGLAERDLVVEGYDVVAKDVVLLTLVDQDGLPLPEWEPGAHIDLVLTPEVTRQYSLCGNPEDRQHWQVAVLREPESRGGSDYVHDSLHVTSRVRARGPRNNFHLVESPRYLFIAGGIGITPIVPMLRAAESAGAEWTLLYGGRSRASMAFTDELRAAGDASVRGRVELCPQDEVGLLDLASYLGSVDSSTRVYCCGPEPLLQAVEFRCAEERVESLHLERFRVLDAGPGESFAIELRRTGRTLTVGANQRILDVLEAEGIEVISSCGEGTCGTCVLGVLEGIPDHRDSVLTESERAAGREILPCISRSLSPLLVLDV
jgi:ferredoxin-NADP reductase